MTTKTPTQAEISKARAVLETLEANHLAAETAKDERVTAALNAEAQWRFTEHTRQLSEARYAAEDEANAVAANPDSTLEELWRAFAAWRAASRAHFDGARANAAIADARLGVRRNSIGVEEPRPRPAEDMAAHMTFNDFLERHVEAQAHTATRAEANRILEREAEAIAEAEQG